MIRWNEELKDNDILTIDYFKYFTHYSAVLMTFKRLCKGKYEDHDTIDAIELFQSIQLLLIQFMQFNCFNRFNRY